MHAAWGSTLAFQPGLRLLKFSICWAVALATWSGSASIAYAARISPSGSTRKIMRSTSTAFSRAPAHQGRISCKACPFPPLPALYTDAVVCPALESEELSRWKS